MFVQKKDSMQPFKPFERTNGARRDGSFSPTPSRINPPIPGREPASPQPGQGQSCCKRLAAQSKSTFLLIIIPPSYFPQTPHTINDPTNPCPPMPPSQKNVPSAVHTPGKPRQKSSCPPLPRSLFPAFSLQDSTESSTLAEALKSIILRRRLSQDYTAEYADDLVRI